ncbi:helix-turn-helix domain-containing protein [Cohnella hashimotonis]|uniref:Helix-turn-helix domain-containing protein n=1 Tax=Cohnella hashimotonis TaxID=2826895 RepID=A0ABT6TS33_9BACL|nr:helix-turn-helix domain-containing protein [Cohnella hashimotonis]MDI4649529.1 helix-turn-helix domain-containing protein [Cohnella hashimotonis]
MYERLPVLIAIAGGGGVLRTDGGSYELAAGSVVLLPANAAAELVADPAFPLHAYKLAIGTREPVGAARTGAAVRNSEAVSGTAIQYFPYEPDIAAQAEELYVHRSPGSEIRHIRNQILLHQIILRLLERQEAAHAAGVQPSMARSVAYMETHYSDKITRELLAEIAGVSASHYSMLFKQRTGFSLSDYLSRLRVHRAKELLLGGTGTLREIAQKVGYKDEFYLSRRFKQQTGEPPSDYGRESFGRVAVWLTPYAVHLQTLGLDPAVLVSDSGEYLSKTDPLERITMTIVDAASSAEEVKAALLANRVELVIAASLHLHQCGLSPDHLRVVAPIAEIPWMEFGWQAHLRLIARFVQQSDRAERWLADFEKEEQAARAIVSQSASADEVITILVIKPEHLFVYGARNAGYVIYQSLGLRPPAKIAREIGKLGDQFHSVPIRTSELADYAGDRILVIVFPDVRGSTAHSEAVFRSADWQELAAVQAGRVHALDHSEWIPYNPVSIRLQLRRALALLSDEQ